ncbi:MAG: PIN domain-containing protein [Gammaproteobacteria bacterium]|nr:PIN domain-containing protein [Gammaproteobacteria bacterium]
MINLDTHILVFALAGELREKERDLLRNHSWGISGIVLWELAKLVQLDRLQLDLEDRFVRRTLGSVHVWPIDLDVANMSTKLDFQSDPADELIAATSIVHEVPLLTRDDRIRQSKLVPFA